MKTFFKVITALAAVAGAVYVVATYGDKIVAWAKGLLASMPKCPCCQDADIIVEAEDEPIPEVPVEEAPAEEPAPEAPAAPVSEPVAEDNDFAE